MKVNRGYLLNSYIFWSSYISLFPYQLLQPFSKNASIVEDASILISMSMAILIPAWQTSVRLGDMLYCNRNRKCTRLPFLAVLSVNNWALVPLLISPFLLNCTECIFIMLLVYCFYNYINSIRWTCSHKLLAALSRHVLNFHFYGG